MANQSIKARLIELEAATPNLMNLLKNSEWVRLSAQLEEESGGEIGAGYNGIHLNKLISNPKQFTQIKRLQTIVLSEFQDLLTDLNLGIGIEAAFVCGRGLVLERLAEPTVEIQEKLWAILAEDEATRGANSPNPLRGNAKQILRQVLKDPDWEAIASAANHSIRSHLLEYGRHSQSA